MKKSINKLSLNKSTIANLSNTSMNELHGGAKSNGCLPPNFTNPCGTLGCSVGCPTWGCSIACPSKWCTVK